MTNARFRSATVALAAALGAGLLFGCATSKESQTETLSREEFRFLYPRQYLDSLDPLERRDAEHRMMEDELRRERKR